MERVVFEQLQRDWGTTAVDGSGNVITFVALEEFLAAWNKMSDEPFQYDGPKVAALNAQLAELGLPLIEIYEPYVGLGCRLQFLRAAHLIHADGQATANARAEYPGVILDTATRGAEACAR